MRTIVQHSPAVWADMTLISDGVLSEFDNVWLLKDWKSVADHENNQHVTYVVAVNSEGLHYS